MLIVSKIIKELRKSENLTQQQVADYLQIGRTNYSKYERALFEPSIETIRKLALLYDVSTDYILGMDEYLKNNKNKK